MPKANNRNIYEERPWLNDDAQNRTVLRQIVGGGSDITVESITITENDTYIAPEGKAYSPVIVNVAGGSSDFSTATITLVNNTESDGNFILEPDYEVLDWKPNANIYKDGYFEQSSLWVEAGETSVHVIYMGDYFFCEFLDDQMNLGTASGSAEVVTIQGEDPFQTFKVNGDCTLTISGS